jgi:hypothetical protein
MNTESPQDGAEPSPASGGYAREWQVARRWCDITRQWRHFLLNPHGVVDSSFDDSPLGRSEAYGYADTYNMNADRAAEFRECPYCKDGCPWCA